MILHDKVVVITGGTKGIGYSLTKFFKKENARVVICSRDTKTLRNVSEELGVLAIEADVSQQSDMQMLTDKTVHTFGKIDIWINNAGVRTTNGNEEDSDFEKVKDMFDINFFGTVFGSLSATTQMKKQNEGIILNIISLSALVGRPKGMMYSSSKWAVRGFTESLRLSLKDTDIKVFALYPGVTKTNIFDTEGLPPEYDSFMESDKVAEILINNLKQDEPEADVYIGKPEDLPR